MFGSLGLPEILFIAVVALLVFGPRRLPEIGRTMGRFLGEFRRATSDLKRTIDTEVTLEEVRQPPASAPPPAVAPQAGPAPAEPADAPEPRAEPAPEAEPRAEPAPEAEVKAARTAPEGDSSD